MKLIANALDISTPEFAGAPDRTQLAWQVDSRPLERATSRCSLSHAMRVVGLMAFAQSLLFLIIWLLVCSTAGAATVRKAAFGFDLRFSTFEPVNGRDPFSKVGLNSTEARPLPGSAIALQLDGILYEDANPSAIVNGQLLTLDKSVTLPAGNGEVKVRAVEIARDHVVVDAGGQKIELKLSTRNSTTRP